MPRHIIRVEYLEATGTIDNIEFSVSSNNVSSSSLNNLSNVNSYNNGFILNSSDLSGKYTYFGSDNAKYYISSILSDERNSIDITLNITTSNAQAISLVFANEVYPTKILVDDVEYTNTNNTFQVVIANNPTKIRFIDMNLPNVPLIVTNINTGITIDYNDNYIISIQRGSQLSTDNTLPKYEVVGQYGSCSFIDSDYVVVNLKASGILKRPKSVKFLLDGEIIGCYKVENWNYNITTSVIDINLMDSIDEMSDVKIEQKSATYMPPKYIVGSQGDWELYTAYDLFEKIKSLVIQYGETFDDIDSNIIDWLNSLIIKVLKYSASDLKSLIVDFCNFAQISLYKKENGKIGVYLWR